MKYSMHLGHEVVWEKDLAMNRNYNELNNCKEAFDYGLSRVVFHEWVSNYCLAIQFTIYNPQDVSIAIEDEVPFVALCFAGSAVSISEMSNFTEYALDGSSNVLIRSGKVHLSFRTSNLVVGECFVVVFSQIMIELLTLRNPVVVEQIKKGSLKEGCINPDFNIFFSTLESEFIIRQIRDIHKSGYLSSFILETKAQELLSIYLSQKEKDKCLACSCFVHYRDQIYEAKERLEAQFQNPPTLKQLAQDVGLCETILKTGFKSFFGITVYNYLFDYRMRIARRLLQESQSSIHEVAEKSGYEHQSHFTTAFKRKYGISPGEYRKKAL